MFLGFAAWLHSVEAQRFTPLLPNAVTPPHTLDSIEATSSSISYPFPAQQVQLPEHDSAMKAERTALDSTAASPNQSTPSSGAKLSARIALSSQRGPAPLISPTTSSFAPAKTYPADAHTVNSSTGQTLPAPTVVASLRGGRSAPSETEVGEFIERFQQMYSANDIDTFLALFSADARGNEGGVFADIAKDYRRLFEQRKHRRLTLSGIQWKFEEGTAVGRGRYDALVGATENRPEEWTHGTITLGLRESTDGLRITQLLHTAIE
ncbi:MAG: hypothetical protein ABI411_07405 [Tahibacter sp.]